MPVNWLDVSSLSFNNLLLLERVQISWFPGWLPEPEMAIALRANPTVAWFLRHKCPDIHDWLNRVETQNIPNDDPSAVRKAEIVVMNAINDLLTYVVDPAVYDAQPFLGWDSDELRSLADFTGKTVIDVGAGTGRLTLVAAEKASAVFAVEPVANLRRYLKHKTRSHGFDNVFAVDGLITDLPFPDRFADVTMGGHVFGDHREAEYLEMIRVTKLGGMLILCPGTAEREDAAHQFLLDQGCHWSVFEEPGEGNKRKYWKKV